MPSVPSDCWVHASAGVRQSSIAGHGLFATAAIRQGEPVSRLGGRLVDDGELKTLIAARDRDPRLPYVDSVPFGDRLHLVLPPGQPNHFSNHSCDPNLWWSDGLTLVARRPISAGEELTNDYGTSNTSPHFHMLCHCGSALCRGVVTGGDWSRPELQKRYGRHWIPALLARIEANRGASAV